MLRNLLLVIALLVGFTAGNLFYAKYVVKPCPPQTVNQVSIDKIKRSNVTLDQVIEQTIQPKDTATIPTRKELRQKRRAERRAKKVSK